MKIQSLRWVFALPILLVFACARQGGDLNGSFFGHGSEPSGIIGGTTARPRDVISRSTVFLGDSVEESCSGVLIAPRTVLSAAHCFQDFLDHVGTSVSVPGVLENCAPKVVRTTAVEFAPGYRTVRANSPTGPFDVITPDIALVTLDQEICGALPMALLPEIPEVGATIQTAGFGVGTAGRFPDVIELVFYGQDLHGLAAAMEEPKIPLRLEKKFGDMLDKYAFSLPKVSQESVCEGDSGGPVYLAKDGVNYLVGITSATFPYVGKGTPRCGDAYLQVQVAVAPLLGWIRASMGEASR